MPAYYNEIDPFAAQWLRNLITKCLIAPGDVDERTIKDVKPDDLRGYGQCHFFAGIGGWSYALRLAGWPDDRPVWTGSCPCQPFSVAGSQHGSADERHLWPAFFNLIRECRPGSIFGEQVAGAAGYAWWDHVAADLESAGYAAAAANIGAHSVGAPHKRQRLYWVAHAELPERRSIDVDGKDGRDRTDCGRTQAHGIAGACGEVRCTVADTDGRHASAEREQRSWQQRQQQEDGGPGLLGNADGEGLQGRIACSERSGELFARTTGMDCWSDLEWITCSDGKARPTEPGIFPLAYGLPKGLVRGGDRSMAPDADASAEGRVMRLRGYGNSIAPQLAAAFVIAAT